MSGDPNNPQNCMPVGGTCNAACNRNKQQAKYCISKHSDSDDVCPEIDDR